MLVGGRPRKSWLECVNDDMKKFGFEKGDGTRWDDVAIEYSWERLNCATMENVTLNG